MKHKAIIIAVLSAFVPIAASAACPPVSTERQYDKRAVQQASCAFSGAAENDVHGRFEGHASIDLGNGQVGQKLIKSVSSCGGAAEILVVLNCTSGTSAALAGTVDPVFKPRKTIPMSGPARPTYIKNIQPPHGPIGLGQGKTLSQIRSIAKKHRIGEYTSLNALRIGKRPRNRVDFWCGCKRFYPSSAGAKL